MFLLGLSLWQHTTKSASQYYLAQPNPYAILFLMQLLGRRLLALAIFAATSAFAAPLNSCSQAARAFQPCELSFELHAGGTAPASPYRQDLLNVAFRSPRATTYLIHAFLNGNSLKVRFTPTEAGTWAYRVSSPISLLDNQESTFTVSENPYPGFVAVANLRHWWTTNKQPHLWFAAAVPVLAIDSANLSSWLDARKRDGFTHIRATLLTAESTLKPLTADGQPDPAYFNRLDDALLAIDTRGFTLDLILADDSFLKTGALKDWQTTEPLVRYLIARYGALNVTWQGIQHFEDTPGSRLLLKQIGALLQQYDAFSHPRSTDARFSSSPLGADGWMTYLIESSPDPQLAAVEHQFTQMPEIHVLTATEPAAFRHELWNCTTNGEYPSVSYEALKNEANVKAVQTWFHIVSDTRHWELEPYFDVSGARAVGLEEVEYLAYAETPGIVEVTLPRHKYNPIWVNPATGEELPLKNYRGEVFSQQTPDNSHDWILQVPREGHKESMLRSYRFESAEPPVQELETDTSNIPFQIIDPKAEELSPSTPVPYSVKLAKSNRSTRTMQYVWWGEIVANEDGPRVLGLGSSGNFTVNKRLVSTPPANLNLRVQAINANGKAFELDRVYRLTQ